MSYSGIAAERRPDRAAPPGGGSTPPRVRVAACSTTTLPVSPPIVAPNYRDLGDIARGRPKQPPWGSANFRLETWQLSFRPLARNTRNFRESFAKVSRQTSAPSGAAGPQTRVAGDGPTDGALVAVAGSPPRPRIPLPRCRSTQFRRECIPRSPRSIPPPPQRDLMPTARRPPRCGEGNRYGCLCLPPRLAPAPARCRLCYDLGSGPGNLLATFAKTFAFFPFVRDWQLSEKKSRKLAEPQQPPLWLTRSLTLIRKVS